MEMIFGEPDGGRREDATFGARPERPRKVADHAMGIGRLGVWYRRAQLVVGLVVRDKTGGDDRPVGVMARVGAVRRPHRGKKHRKQRGKTRAALAQSAQHRRTTVTARSGDVKVGTELVLVFRRRCVR